MFDGVVFTTDGQYANLQTDLLRCGMIATRLIMPIRILVAAQLAGVFLTSMIPLPAQIPTPDLQNGAMVRREMTAFNPHYLALMRPRSRALRELEQQVMKREAEMLDVSCSHQIVTELRWLMGSTVDTERIDARLNDLRASLAHPELESRARKPDADGSWGAGLSRRSRRCRQTLSCPQRLAPSGLPLNS